MYLLKKRSAAVIALFSGLSLTAAAAQAAGSTQTPAVSVTVNSLTASPATVTPGQTVTFSAGLTANENAAGYPVEFSLFSPGASTSTNTVDSATFKTGTKINETSSWDVPAGTKPGTYKLIVSTFTPSWSAILAQKTITFAVAAAGTATPLAVTVDSLTASPPTVLPGQTVTFSAALTANETVSGFPVKFSWLPAGTSTSINATDTANYVAGSAVTETTSWTVPANTAPGTYTLGVAAFNQAQSSLLGSKSATFTVGATTITSPTPTPGAAGLPGPSAALYAAPFYSCTRNFYVATTGNNSNPGTQASPWQTIQNADSASREAGDCINVAPGTYEANVLLEHGGNAPTPTGYIAYRCETLDGCHVLAPGSGHLWGIKQPANFVVIDGFEIDGNNALVANGVADACIGSDGDTYGTGNSSHHIWVLNNILHDCNLAGISFNNKEWYYVINNTIDHNSWTSGFQGSGLGFVVVQCVESGNSACASGSTYAGGTGTYVPSGMDLTYAPPFHNVVKGNNVFDNMIAATNPVGCGAHTDGNGIIMDTFLDETTLTLVYPFQTLITGNVSYDNGGRGIHVFRTSNVTVANNTVYGNGTDTCINAFWLADLSQAGGP